MLQTDDAGAFFRFTGYVIPEIIGGQLELALEPPTVEPSAKEGLVNVRATSPSRARLRSTAWPRGGSTPGTQSGVSFSALRAEFTRQSGQLAIRDGVVKGPMIGATIEGNIDTVANQVRMSGTFVPMYGLNNMFGQIPVLGLFLGNGNNEGLIGVTYEVVGTPGAPVLRVESDSRDLSRRDAKIIKVTTPASRTTARSNSRRITSAGAPERPKNGIHPEHHRDQREGDHGIVAVGPVMDQAAGPGAEP